MPAHPLAFVLTHSRLGRRSIVCPWCDSRPGLGWSLYLPARNALAVSLKLRAALLVHVRSKHKGVTV